jgi:hypothetical protein
MNVCRGGALAESLPADPTQWLAQAAFGHIGKPREDASIANPVSESHQLPIDIRLGRSPRRSHGRAGTNGHQAWRIGCRETQMLLDSCPDCQSDCILVERAKKSGVYRIRCLQCNLSMEQEEGDHEQDSRQPLRELLKKWQERQRLCPAVSRSLTHCPFCGYDIPLIEQVDRSEFRIRCPKCGGSVRRRVHPGKDQTGALTELARLWNERTQSVPQRAGVLASRTEVFSPEKRAFKIRRLFVKADWAEDAMRRPDSFLYGLLTQYGAVYSVRPDFSEWGGVLGYVVEMDPGGATRVLRAWEGGQVEKLLRTTGFTMRPWPEQQASRDLNYALRLRLGQLELRLEEASDDPTRRELEEQIREITERPKVSDID